MARLLRFPVSPQVPAASRRSRARQRGQVVVLFAGAMIALLALCAIVIDVAWYWTNNLRIQRAADAASLAGVVWLPGSPSTAATVARAEAAKNGYTHGSGGVAITPTVDPNNNRRLRVVISAPVGTFFARAVGVNTWPASRTALADYVLPVPMGSPDNYYGVGYFVKPEVTTTTEVTDDDDTSDWEVPGNAISGGQWQPDSGSSMLTPVQSNNSRYVYENTNGHQHSWSQFGLLSGGSAIPNPAGNQVLTITGIEVRLTDIRLSAACANSTIGVDLSWNNGGTWSTRVNTPNLTTSEVDRTLGSASSTAAWGGRTWTHNDFSDANLRLRLTANKGCTTANRQLRVDMIEIRVSWNIETTTTVTTTTLIEDAVVPPPPGQAAITRPQKIWGAMQSQGAPSAQGDAFMTKYDVRTSSLSVEGGSDPDVYYAPDEFYNYAVEIPAGGGGALWIFDPGFCDGQSVGGTGEYWTIAGANGYPGGTNPNRANAQPISAYFDLYDTQETLLDEGDDSLVATTGNTYRRMQYDDHRIFDAEGDTPNFADCSNLGWHHQWVQVASGLPAGTYRLHTYSTDFGSPNDQNNATATNSFALYAAASSGTPRIYGIGAMQAYARLPANKATEFYFAQIEAVHAGKTMVINLWDPGDTGNLSASLQILQPTGTGFTPVQFDYEGTSGSSPGDSTGCNSRSGSGAWSVTTNPGGGPSNSYYNGCWLTMEVQIPASYTAPTDPASGEDGWWKIKYTMGSGSQGATDMTTWKVDIRGNPVHLVTP